MKRPLLLPLAIAFALSATNALALGLGPVRVNSKLNQPLDAEIPVLQGSANEAEGLLVTLGASEDFERMGLSRSRLNVPLEFAVVRGTAGNLVIKVTSKEPVRDSFLDFLVEANWPKGRLLREYTVLLDPPLTAPATRSAASAAAPVSPGTVTVERRERPAVAATHSTPAAAPRAQTKAAPENKTSDGKYGPVEAGQTLSEIARETGERRNVNQMMLALWKSNPNAFYKDNINALKRGAVLRIPSDSEIKSIGSATEAAAQVQSQVEDWRGGRASPTLLADAGSSTAATAPTAAGRKAATPSSASTASSNERLELVPPKAGKDSLAMADRPGAGAGSPAATELKSELARTKEALSSRDQESGELRSRVKELEDLKNKNDRLIGLKDSEIAELQQKLKQLQDKPGAAPTMAVSTPPATSAAPTVATPPVPASGAAGTSAAPSTSATPTLMSAATPTSTTAPASPSASTAAPTTPSAMASTASPSATGSTPSEAAAAATAPAAAVVAKPSPAPVKALAKPKPIAPSSPWYAEPWVVPAALAAGVLLLLLGLFGARKRKVAPASAQNASISSAFGDSPLELTGATAPGTHAAEEAELLGELQNDPTNVGLHLELLSLYYAEHDTAKFEYAAAEMHSHVIDPHSPEWLEAQAMGRELAPHNPLFADPYGDVAAADVAFTEPSQALPDRHVEHDYAPHADVEYVEPGAPVHDPKAAESHYAFDLDDTHFDTPPPVPAHVEQSTAKHESFGFDLPPLDIDPPAAHHRASNGHDLDIDDEHLSHADSLTAQPASVQLDDDYFPGDDAVGTKLDLAKAYMDMGDPEGARSMLEEVVAEGSDVQKAEAHRLMTEIR